MNEDIITFEIHGLKLHADEISGLQQIADFHEETINKTIHRAIGHLFYDFFNHLGKYRLDFKKKKETNEKEG